MRRQRQRRRDCITVYTALFSVFLCARVARVWLPVVPVCFTNEFNLGEPRVRYHNYASNYTLCRSIPMAIELQLLSVIIAFARAMNHPAIVAPQRRHIVAASQRAIVAKLDATANTLRSQIRHTLPHECATFICASTECARRSINST